jgi:hypothetical protein
VVRFVTRSSFLGCGASAGEAACLPAANVAADFRDVRFTAADGVTLLPAWAEAVSPGLAAIWWVRMRDPLATAAAAVYV